MNQISPFKSTAFRITLVYLLLFGLSVAIILGFIYWSTIIYKTQQTDVEIDAEILELSLVYEQKGLPEFLTVLSERVDQLRSRPGDPSVYLLVDSRYENVVSSIDRWPRVARDSGKDWLDFEVEGVSTRAKVYNIEDRYHLLVGQSMKDLTTLKALVSNAMVWGLMLTLGLGVFGGFMMRQILRSRLGTINQTSRKIMHGDLRKRIKTRGTGDEFDELAINLNSMLDQIERGMEGVRRVSDNIAHDLKTPLARLKNRVEELKMRADHGSEEEAAVDQIILEADGLLATFNALLRIARIEYSEQRKGFKTVDINSILYDIEELYEPLIEEKGQSLTVSISEPMEIFADRDMLFQVFANLLDNAIKYTPVNGVVAIRSFKKNDKWYVEITDNGPGIPKEEHEKVVQRFYRLDQSRTTPGSGLGLALVFAVLKVHKLKLAFEDNSPGLKVLISADPKKVGAGSKYAGELANQAKEDEDIETPTVEQVLA